MNCLSAFCPNGASYDVQVVGDWWWPECTEHTADMRTKLSHMVLAVQSHDPLRDGKVALRDS